MKNGKSMGIKYGPAQRYKGDGYVQFASPVDLVTAIYFLNGSHALVKPKPLEVNSPARTLTVQPSQLEFALDRGCFGYLGAGI